MCRKHDIKYFMEGGTLMGDVKYKNFVAWNDAVPSKLRFHCALVGLLTTARKIKLKFIFKTNIIKKAVYKIVSLFPMKMLTKLIDRACTIYNVKDTGYLYEVCNSNKKFKPLPSYIYDELIKLDFRDKKFYAVKEYDVFLKSRFGENYMNELPDENNRLPSHCQNILIKE